MMKPFPVGEKPFDFGFGGVMGCLNPSGRVTALSTYHPVHGVVTLTSAPPFPDADRYDSGKVRAYRRGLLTLEGVGLEFNEPDRIRVISYMNDTPILNRHFNAVMATCATLTIPPHGIQQTWRLSGTPPARVTGTVWAQRCAYAQLTEGGPLPPVSAETHPMIHEDGTLTLHNAAIGWAVSIGARQNRNRTIEDVIRDPLSAGQVLPLSAHANPDGSVTLSAEVGRWQQSVVICYGVGNTPQESRAALVALQALPPADIPLVLQPSTDTQRLDPLESRAWDYTRLCAVPVPGEQGEHEESVCILTDHMILPLSWNRDAYYAARLLLSASNEWETVRKHLIWMFERAERINGLWGRSYLANGRVKDRGFQLDQQLFPLLELADYVHVTGDRATLERLKPHIAPVFDHLAAHRAPHALLYATDETPADDPIALPYPLSSHVLLWRVIRELRALGCEASLPFPASAVEQSIHAHFVATPPDSDTPLYAYATDGKGAHHFYHDANDIPLVLMPAWGFCPPDDPLWRATIDFAFSPANEGGYYGNALGSVHTRAPWALGDIQEWIVARATGDTPREVAVLARLKKSAQWDGALSEAYDGDSGAVVSRHWFLWTNAAYACVKRGIFEP